MSLDQIIPINITLVGSAVFSAGTPSAPLIESDFSSATGWSGGIGVSIAPTVANTLTFNGTDSYIDIDALTGASLGTNTYIEAMFKTNVSGQANPYSNIFFSTENSGYTSAGGSGPSDIVCIGTDGESGAVYNRVNGLAADNTTLTNIVENQSFYNDNQWHHLLIHFGGSTRNFYVDGQDISNIGFSTNFSGISHYRLGADYTHSTGTVELPYSGSIANVVVGTGQAINPTPSYYKEHILETTGKLKDMLPATISKYDRVVTESVPQYYYNMPDATNVTKNMMPWGGNGSTTGTVNTSEGMSETGGVAIERGASDSGFLPLPTGSKTFIDFDRVGMMFECWVYPTASSDSGLIMGWKDSGSPAYLAITCGRGIQETGTGTLNLVVDMKDKDNNQINIETTTPLTQNAWNHILVNFGLLFTSAFVCINGQKVSDGVVSTLTDLTLDDQLRILSSNDSGQRSIAGEFQGKISKPTIYIENRRSYTSWGGDLIEPRARAMRNYTAKTQGKEMAVFSGLGRLQGGDPLGTGNGRTELPASDYNTYSVAAAESISGTTYIEIPHFIEDGEKKYWEMKVVSSSGGYAIGLNRVNGNNTGTLGTQNDSGIRFSNNSSTIFFNGDFASGTGWGSPYFTINDVVAMSVENKATIDGTAILTVYVNNVQEASYTWTGLSAGESFLPKAEIATDGTTNGEVKFFLATDDQTYAPPSGFTALAGASLDLREHSNQPYLDNLQADSNVQAIYRLNETSGTVATDSSSNNYNGVINNVSFTSEALNVNGAGTLLTKVVVDGTQTGVTTLTSSTNLQASRVYTVEFVVIDYVAGTVTPKLGTNTGTARNANGTFTENILSDGTTFSLEFSADFVGSIDSIKVTPN